MDLFGLGGQDAGQGLGLAIEIELEMFRGKCLPGMTDRRLEARGPGREYAESEQDVEREIGELMEILNAARAASL